MGKLCLLVMLGLLPAGGSVFSGRVVEDHTGNPLARAEIRITRPKSSAAVAELETDREGRFHTPDLPESVYTLRFSKTDYSSAEVTTGARTGMVLRLTRFGAIAGKITDGEGHPVEARVVALTESDVELGVEDPTARLGEYRIYDLPPGKYRVAILSSGGWPGQRGMLFHPNNDSPRTFEVTGGEDYTGADFLLPAGPSFRISARAQSNARAVGFVLVSADHPGHMLGQEMVSSGRAFTVEHVLPGRYEILAGTALPGTASQFARTPVTVVAADVDDVEVPVDQTRSAAFLLRALNGCGTAATVELKAREAWLANRPVTAALEAGKPTTVSTLAPARYAVTVKPAGANCYPMEVPDLDLTRGSASSATEIALASAGSIHGAAKGPVTVVLTSHDPSFQRVAFPDEGGSFAFADLPPGMYHVVGAGADGHWPGTSSGQMVKVTGGESTVVELRKTEGVR